MRRPDFMSYSLFKLNLILQTVIFCYNLYNLQKEFKIYNVKMVKFESDQQLSVLNKSFLGTL